MTQAAKDLVMERLRAYYPESNPHGWLYCKQAVCRGSRPIDMINRGLAKQVLGAIDRMDAVRRNG